MRRYLETRRIVIPASIEQALLREYGQPWLDDEGHLNEYTEQDIVEQLRKLVDQNAIKPEPIL